VRSIPGVDWHSAREALARGLASVDPLSQTPGIQFQRETKIAEREWPARIVRQEPFHCLDDHRLSTFRIRVLNDANGVEKYGHHEAQLGACG
jgi:hypothetical protein